MSAWLRKRGSNVGHLNLENICLLVKIDKSIQEMNWKHSMVEELQAGGFWLCFIGSVGQNRLTGCNYC